LTSLNKSSINSPTKNELLIKREKLEEELISIEDELFELEKKYGEFKKPEIDIKDLKSCLSE
jgi:hypothetical protein